MSREWGNPPVVRDPRVGWYRNAVRVSRCGDEACEDQTVRAVMAVADAEMRDLWAEVERLRGTLEAANDAVAEAAIERAEAAEAKVARVEALRDRWLEDGENDNIRLADTARDLTAVLSEKRGAAPKTPCPECRCLYGTHQKACPGYAQPARALRARADEIEADK